MTKETSQAHAKRRFFHDVRDHKMEIVYDDGVNRHVRFSNPNCFAYHFSLTTWHHRLCISGDMGDYVFSRLPDMFTFFRTGSKHELGINEYYWSEKLTSIEHRDAMEYSEEVFRRIVVGRYRDWRRENPYNEDLKLSLRDDVLRYASDGEQDAYRAASDFRHEASRFEMSDFWEHNLRDWRFHFLWCCWAITWGIRQYDEAKDAVVTEKAA